MCNSKIFSCNGVFLLMFPLRVTSVWLYFNSLVAQTFCTEFRTADKTSISSPMILKRLKSNHNWFILYHQDNHYTIIKMVKSKISSDKSWGDINEKFYNGYEWNSLGKTGSGKNIVSDIMLCCSISDWNDIVRIGAINCAQVSLDRFELYEQSSLV